MDTIFHLYSILSNTLHNYMLAILAWYLLISALGWMTFPLVFRVFRSLPDRGFSLARTFGMLVWAYLFWMMGSLGMVQNDISGLLLAFVILAIISLSGLRREELRKAIREWINSNVRLIITGEILFFLAFCFLVFVRAGNPEIVGTEKPMELAFINAILRSPTFPPHDPWLSGYAISYYYFGYVMTAMLAKATGTIGSVAFNLMLSLVFALSALGAYGVLYNLLAEWRKNQHSTLRGAPFIGLPLLGPLFLLIVSNFEGFLEVLHRRGLFWSINATGSATSGFWNWLDLKDLREPPSIPLGWIPDRYYWWWRASRVITEYNLAHQWSEIIDEFPFFSYLLGDLHPHVLAMPFGLLAVGMAFNLYLGGWKGETKLGLYQLPIHPLGLAVGALVLGGLAFLNTWDILLGFALFIGAFTLLRVHESGWAWKRIEDIFALGIPLGLMAILLYIPFYMGFSSQAGGILPNLENPTRGAQLWIMFGPLFLPIFAFLVFLWRSEKRPGNWKFGFGLAGILAVLLCIFSWVLGVVAKLKMPEFVASYLANQGFLNAALYFSAAMLRRVSFIGGLLTILVLLGIALAYLIKMREDSFASNKVVARNGQTSGIVPEITTTFILFLILLGGVLVLAPEFVFLRDQFSDRMNTIFKFYYQAWMLWSLAAAFGVAILFQKLRGSWNLIFRVGLTMTLFMGLIYPVLGLLTKTSNFQIPAFNQTLSALRSSGESSALIKATQVWTLDGGAFFDRLYPDDMSAAAWLRNEPYGIIVEATKPDASYTDWGHISVYSGLPTVLGWPMHEGQWRGTYEPQGSRQDDIRSLYETTSWETANTILSKYGIRYIFIGTLERTTYHVNENKFQGHLTQIFHQGQVTIFEVP